MPADPVEGKVRTELARDMTRPQELVRQFFLEVDGLPLSDGPTCDENEKLPSRAGSNTGASDEELALVQNITDVSVLYTKASWEFFSEEKSEMNAQTQI